MTYLETLREDKIKQETVLAIAKGNYFSEITKMEGEWVKMLEDMYGASGMFVSIEFSSWSEALEVSIKKKENDYRPLFKIKFKTDDVSLSGFRDVDLDTDIEDITLYSTLLLDFTTKKGLFSVGTSNLTVMSVLREELRMSTNEMQTITNSFEKELLENKQSHFYEVVKDGDVIVRNSTESWNVTKITNKCVFAIHVDYTDCVSRRYNKNQFYIDTKDFVKLESVTE